MSELVDESVDETIKSPQETELEHLKNKELWLKEEIKKPDSYMSDLYSTSSPKKDNISLWAENLERQHDLEVELKFKPTLNSVGQISAYIKSEMRGLGVHQSTLAYVHEVLGYKYKNDKYNSVRLSNDEGDAEPRLNSSNKIANFPEENKQILELIKQQKEFLKNFENKCKSSHIISKLDSKELLEYEEINIRTQATILMADQIIDDRQSVPIFAQFKLVMAIVASTNNYAAGQYVSQIKEFGSNRMESSKKFFEETSKPLVDSLSEKNKILFATTMKNIKSLNKSLVKLRQKPSSHKTDVMTSKQAMKIVFAVVKKVLSVFDHNTRDEAILDGFYGIQCPECGSYRVKEKDLTGIGEWVCFCYNCEWNFEARTVVKCWNCHLPFFDDILKIIKKTATIIQGKDGSDTGARDAKCPRCENELILPAKMFLKPKLRSR